MVSFTENPPLEAQTVDHFREIPASEILPFFSYDFRILGYRERISSKIFL